MSGHFPLDATHGNPLGNEKGSTTRVLLLVLLLVVGAAGYLFYFTDMFKPHQEPPKPPAGQAAQVKQPIPPRPGPGGGTATAPAKPGETKPPQASPAGAPVTAQPPTLAAQKPAPVKPAAPVAPVPAVRPKPVPAAAPKPAPPAPVPAQAAKPAPAAAAKAAKPATPGAAPVKTAKAAAPAAPPKAPAPAKTPQKAEKPVEAKKGGAYRLLLGDFVPDKTFGALVAKVKGKGIEPVRKSGITASEPMNRLFIAQYNDQDSAEAELQNLKKHTADAFLVSKDGTYELFAGSYLSPSRAASEIRKLNAKGFRPVIRTIRVPVKVTRVTAGSYASSDDARKDVARLKKIGISATVIKSGR